MKRTMRMMIGLVCVWLIAGCGGGGGGSSAPKPNPYFGNWIGPDLTGAPCTFASDGNPLVFTAVFARLPGTLPADGYNSLELYLKADGRFEGGVIDPITPAPWLAGTHAVGRVKLRLVDHDDDKDTPSLRYLDCHIEYTIDGVMRVYDLELADVYNAP